MSEHMGSVGSAGSVSNASHARVVPTSASISTRSSRSRSLLGRSNLGPKPNGAVATTVYTSTLASNNSNGTGTSNNNSNNNNTNTNTNNNNNNNSSSSISSSNNNSNNNKNTNDVSSTSNASRPRRRSLYPPTATTGSSIARPPRKSVGAMTSDPVTAPPLPRVSKPTRRPSLASSNNSEATATANRSRTSVFETGTANNSGGSGGLGLGRGEASTPRLAANARAVKAKSVQGPRRSNIGGPPPPSPEKNRLSTIIPRSPRVSGGGRAAAPGSMSKRLSLMPHSSHASGLGARTVSPTDARRLKRLSALPTELNTTELVDDDVPPPPPPPQLLGTTHPSSHSPSLGKAVPSKNMTPSSSRTTPDAHRRSFLVGSSFPAPCSAAVTRTPTNLVNSGKAAQLSLVSRLLSPRANAGHNTNVMPEDEDSDVPPVPAIPKAYESPKDPEDEGGTFFNVPEVTKKSAASVAKRVTMQPIRLPPITLQPLSTPTTAKIAALQESSRNSPPGLRPAAKTPTTPMTASRSAFFGRGRADDKAEINQFLRSSSSVHNLRDNISSAGIAARYDPDLTCMSEYDESPIPTATTTNRRDISPFLSTSAPRSDGLESLYPKRTRVGADHPGYGETGGAVDLKPPNRKPSGPRPQTHHYSSFSSTALPPATARSPPPPRPPASPAEPATPSSISTLKRKLSLTWKRSSSKSGGAPLVHNDKSGEPSGVGRQNALASRHDAGPPPPRLPVTTTRTSIQLAREQPRESNTVNAAASPASAKTSGVSSYLDSRRRKSSISSPTSHDRKQNGEGGWGTSVPPHSTSSSKTPLATADVIEKMPHAPTVPTTSALRDAAPRPKVVRPKPSLSGSGLQPQQQQFAYVADIDSLDLEADTEMRKLAHKRKETEVHAKTLDSLERRATRKERASPQEAIQIAALNIYERGEILVYDDVYFCGTPDARKVVGDVQSKAPNYGYDDERGDYIIVPGDHLAYRFEVIDLLGKGSFGQVVRCIDHKLGILVAVKIIRNKRRFHQQALVEVNILAKLKEWDPDAKHSMVHFTDHFYFRDHLCISTELLDMNLYEFIKANNFRGFSLKLIRRFTKQILSSLNLLKGHKVIHCDLKPENILLRHPMHSEIKVIDFGSSCFENQKVYTYIQSRFYRSPEVILGMSYGLPIDMWSLGCILAELYTGIPIFPGENEQEQLACIMEIFGPPEKHLIERSSRKKLFFDSLGKPRLTVSPKGRRRRPSSKTLNQALKCDDEPFLDFISRCLRWDPDRRMRPEEAIKHEFITCRPTAISAVSRRDVSPLKRHNSITAPRPLPEPPGIKAVTNATYASPSKFSSRRTSGANGNSSAVAASGHMKRTSMGLGGSSVAAATGGSGLPRVAARSVSAKQDLTSTVGASAPLGRRA